MTTKQKAEDFEQLERLHSSFVDQFMQYLPDNIFAKMNDAAILWQDASYELGRQRGLKEAGAAAEEFRISSDIHQVNRELAERQRDELAAQLAELKGQEPRTLRVVTDKPCPLWNPSATIDLHPVGDRCLHCEGTKFVVEYVPSPQPVAKEDGSDE
ncbi:hypothetical protein D3C80_111690 [compost metagenome]